MIKIKGIIFKADGILILIFTVILAVLQYQWVIQGSVAEEERLRHTLFSNTSHALQNAGDEVKLLITLIEFDYEDYLNQYFEKIYENIDVWFNTVRFPQLLKDIYLFSLTGDTDSIVYKYSREESLFLCTEALASYKELLNTIKNGRPGYIMGRFTREFMEQGVVLFSVREVAEPKPGQVMKPEEPINVLLALHLNQQVFYEQVVPFYLDQFLSNYPFRIIKNRETVVASADFSGQYEPELKIPFPGMLMGNRIILFRDDEPELSEQVITARNPLVDYLFERRMLPIREYLDDAGNEMLLEIYYPAAPLKSIMEFRLLLFLVQNTGRIIGRDELLDEVWGYDMLTTTRTVDVHIAWLRQKLGEKDIPRFIQTVRGFGYRFNPDA